MLEKVMGLGASASAGTRRNIATKAKKQVGGLHTTSEMKYPAAPALKIPSNIDQHESSKFSPQRFRELTASTMLTHPLTFTEPGRMDRIDVTVDSSSMDPHIASYDCLHTVSLNSSMQSNVPQPFGGLHNYAIALAMPGGGYSSLDKYQAGQVAESHYTNLRKEFRQNWYDYQVNDADKKKEWRATARLDPMLLSEIDLHL